MQNRMPKHNAKSPTRPPTGSPPVQAFVYQKKGNSGSWMRQSCSFDALGLRTNLRRGRKSHRVARRNHRGGPEKLMCSPLWNSVSSAVDAEVYCPASAKTTAAVVSTSTGSPFNMKGRYFHCLTASMEA